MLPRLAPLAACSFVVATDGTLVVGLLGRIGRAIVASPAATGQGVTVFAIAFALGAPALVVATRRWPAKRLLLVGLLVFVAANAATGAAASRMLLSFNATALYAGVAIGSAAGGVVLATTHSVAALCLVSAAFGFASAFTLISSARAGSTAGVGHPQSDPALKQGH
jgi:predicted MFS family arabinose efflux permease